MNKTFSYLLLLCLGLLIGRYLVPSSVERIKEQPEQQDQVAGNTRDIEPDNVNGDPSNQLSAVARYKSVYLRAKKKPTIENISSGHQLINSLSEEELVEVITNTLAGDRDRFDEDIDALTGYLFMALSEKNPEKMLSLYLKCPKKNYFYVYWKTVIPAWSKLDTEGMLSAIAEIDDDRLKLEANLSAIAALSDSNPRQAFALLATVPGANDYNYASLIRQWASRDPASARAAIESIPEGGKRFQALRGYYLTMFEEDPHATVKDILEIEDSRDHWLIFYMLDEFDGNLATTSAIIAPIPDGRLRDTLLDNLVEASAKREPEKLYEWALENLQGKILDKAIYLAVETLAKKDLAKAIEIVESLPYGRAYGDSIDSLVVTWSKQDLSGALEWVRGNVDGPERDEAIVRIYSRLTGRDIGHAIEMAESMEVGSEYRMLIGEIANRMSYYREGKDLSKLIVWANGVKDDQARKKALSEIFDAWADQAPDLVAEYFSENNYVGADDYIRDIAENFARRNIDESLEWALKLPTQNLQNYAVEGIMQEWITHDSIEASKWIATLDNGPIRDRTIVALVGNVSYDDPITAFEWALTIQGKDARMDGISSMLWRWSRKDRKAASEAVNAAQFSDEETARYLKIINH